VSLASHQLGHMSAPGAPSTAQQAAQTISQAVSRQDGAGLAAALRLDLGNTMLIAQLNSSPPLEQICGRALVEPWDELLLEQLHYIKAAAAGEHEAAYSHCERAAACFQAAFEKESDWPLPALHSLCLNLRRAAAAADAALVAKGERAARQQEAARTMQKFFQVCVTDRAPLPVSKKWGSVAVEQPAAGLGRGCGEGGGGCASRRARRDQRPLPRLLCNQQLAALPEPDSRGRGSSLPEGARRAECRGAALRKG